MSEQNQAGSTQNLATNTPGPTIYRYPYKCWAPGCARRWCDWTATPPTKPRYPFCGHGLVAKAPERDGA